MIDILCPRNEQFFDHWKGISRDGLVPDISSFHPEEVFKLLPAITVYELVSRDCILIRKGGSAIEHREEYEQKGENYLDKVAPERRAKAAESFFSMYNQPCGMRVVMRHAMVHGTYIILEGLGLPFVNAKSGTPLIYIINHEVRGPADEYLPETPDKFRGMILLQRDFIDIGGGVSDYKD